MAPAGIAPVFIEQGSDLVGKENRWRLLDTADGDRHLPFEATMLHMNRGVTVGHRFDSTEAIYPSNFWIGHPIVDLSGEIRARSVQFGIQDQKLLACFWVT